MSISQDNSQNLNETNYMKASSSVCHKTDAKLAPFSHSLLLQKLV